jgi:hypothetical protein
MGAALAGSWRRKPFGDPVDVLSGLPCVPPTQKPPSRSNATPSAAAQIITRWGQVWRLVFPACGALQQRLHAVDEHCDALLECVVALRWSAFVDSRRQGGGVLDRQAR